jgi:hypothetical protein
MFDAKFKLAAAALIRAAMLEDFHTAELIISQHDPYELTRAMAVISAQGAGSPTGTTWPGRWSPWMCWRRCSRRKQALTVAKRG